jgi:hypothetical protein
MPGQRHPATDTKRKHRGAEVTACETLDANHAAMILFSEDVLIFPAVETETMRT